MAVHLIILAKRKGMLHNGADEKKGNPFNIRSFDCDGCLFKGSSCYPKLQNCPF